MIITVKKTSFFNRVGFDYGDKHSWEVVLLLISATLPGIIVIRLIGCSDVVYYHLGEPWLCVLVKKTKKCQMCCTIV